MKKLTRNEILDQVDTCFLNQISEQILRKFHYKTKTWNEIWIEIRVPIEKQVYSQFKNQVYNQLMEELK